jgi:hypothetical protein
VAGVSHELVNVIPGRVFLQNFASQFKL